MASSSGRLPSNHRNGGSNGNGRGKSTANGNGNGHRNGNGNGHPNGNGTRSAWSTARRRRQGRLRKRGVQGLMIFSGLLGIGLLVAFIISILAAMQIGTAVFLAFNRDLPAADDLTLHQSFKSAQIYDRKGTLLWEFYDEQGGRRSVVPLSSISQYLIDATLAAEDPNFYDNPGVDVKSIIRAAIQNFRADDTVSGASTITQQLVRNVLLDPNERSERSMTRKIREALLAYQVTDRYEKRQILQLYLNEIYYGNLAYGVEAASQTYFSKNSRDLTLPEAALIAGLPQAPALYDPLKNPAAAKERQIYVLDQMARHNFITPAEAEVAKRTRLTFTPLKRDLLAPHWVMYIRNQVEQKYGPRVFESGLKIFTTLDYELQLKMESVAQSNRDLLASRDANNTAIVVVNPRTGEILAQVGSLDYYDKEIDGQVNVPTALPGRQPGSSIKPLVYMTSFTQDYSPTTVVTDKKISLRDELGRVWEPENFDRKFRGNVTLRTALGNSLNIPAVEVLQHVGIDAAADMARKLGITSWSDRSRLGLSLTLGGAEVLPQELAGVYATLANNGRRIPLVSVTKVLDAEGNLIEDYKVPQGDQVVDPRAAYMVTNILSDNNARLITYGPNSLLKTNRPSAVKTGTTDNYRDTWTMGYTPNIVVGVWVGNTDGHPMKEVLSSMSAGKIWREAIDTAVDFLQLPPEDFQRPQGLVDVEVCGDTAMRPGQPQCYKDIFKIEQAPKQPRLYLAGGAPPPPPAPAAEPTPAQPTPVGTAAPAAPPTGQPQQPPAQPKPQQPQAAPTPQPRATAPAQPGPRATQPPAQPKPQPRSEATPAPRQR
jgi:1A family penicillin-binding protein